MRANRIELYLGGEKRVFEDSTAVEIVETLRDEATFFDGETHYEYVSWCVDNINRTRSADEQLPGPDPCGGVETTCESFLATLIGAGLAKQVPA